MEEIYWNRFLETGKIEDYLYYIILIFLKELIIVTQSLINKVFSDND